METVSYESLVASTKQSLSKNVQDETDMPTFSSFFTSLLDDCGECISQSTDFIMQLLLDTNTDLLKLCDYLEDAACLLQLLSNFVKDVIGSISMMCCSLDTFPITTGRIIMNVFTHCKDSETLYGSNLNSVEKQLKELFRSCHELQLTYLMVLEKHFVFDLTEHRELNVLIEALEINLKIGEIVQSLDVKTMAEQWKAYTMICEKYSNLLKDEHIYENCSKVLCTMIVNNIKSGMQLDQEEKVVLRSLKVTSFNIKILLRICNIFKHATTKKYDFIFDMLLYVYTNNSSYLELNSPKSNQFLNMMTTNVSAPCDLLLKELFLDESFINYILKYDIESIRKEDNLLGYILIIVSLMKLSLSKKVETKVSKSGLVDCILKFLDLGHNWFNLGLKYKIDPNAQSYGLFEHVLIHTVVLVATLNPDDFRHVERITYEALFGTDCLTALFSSNLWVLLTRCVSSEISLNQLLFLCRAYQQLEWNKLFQLSPQNAHVSFTIARLFETLSKEEKLGVYTQFRVNDEVNSGLWSVLRIGNLPDPVKSSAEQVVVERLKNKFQAFFSSGASAVEIDELIKTMKLTATCSLAKDHETLENYVVDAWLAVCMKSNGSISHNIDERTYWFLSYIEALISLTESLKYILQKSANVVKILHIISTMLEEGNKELKLMLIHLLCKMSLCHINDDKVSITDSLLKLCFMKLFKDTDDIVRQQFISVLVLKKYSSYKKVENLLSKIFALDTSVRDNWEQFKQDPNKLANTNWRNDISDLRFEHKCIEKTNVDVFSDSESVKIIERGSSHSNFEFTDIDTLFDVESDTEPASKRAKFYRNEIEDTVKCLEKDVSLLSSMKENVLVSDYKDRIRNICMKLNNIIE